MIGMRDQQPTHRTSQLRADLTVRGKHTVAICAQTQNKAIQTNMLFIFFGVSKPATPEATP
jgi:hypothetical protein